MDEEMRRDDRVNLEGVKSLFDTASSTGSVSSELDLLESSSLFLPGHVILEERRNT